MHRSMHRSSPRPAHFAALRDGCVWVALGRIISVIARMQARNDQDRHWVGWVALGHLFAYRLLYATLARRLLMGIVTQSVQVTLEVTLAMLWLHVLIPSRRRARVAAPAVLSYLLGSCQLPGSGS